LIEISPRQANVFKNTSILKVSGLTACTIVLYMPLSKIRAMDKIDVK